MKKLLLACTYIVVLVYTSNALALTYSEIMKLENPFDPDDDSQDGITARFVRLMAERDKFEECQEDLDIGLMFSNRKRLAESVGESWDEYRSKESLARHLGVDYSYISNHSDISDNLVLQLAIDTGWDNPSANDQEVDLFANIYWDKCKVLPIEAFEALYKENLVN